MYEAPRFDLIEDEHYRPAFDAGLRRKREEIAAIAGNPQPATFENTFAALEKSGTLLHRVTAVPPPYRSSYFAHIFGGGYAAGYYAYIWTQMLADDGYQWFVEQGGLTRENGQRFREAILSRGNSSDLEALCRSWRGHEPRPEPMLKNRGLSE